MKSKKRSTGRESPPEIIVRFRAGVPLPFGPGAAGAGDRSFLEFERWRRSARAIARPCFPLLAERVRRASRRVARPRVPLSAIDRFVGVLIPTGADPVRLALEASRLRGVEYTAVAPAGGPPPQTPDHTRLQEYLKPRPHAIGAHAAWRLAGGAGQAVNVCVCDHGFRAFHEDLPAVTIVPPLPQGIPANGEVGTTAFDHGTEVLGVLAAMNDQKGVTGISYATNLLFAPVNVSNRKETIDLAIASLAAGDVLVLEMQVTITPPNGVPFTLPQEHDLAIREALKDAARLGIVVVAAAGNGDTDLGTIEETINVGGRSWRARIWDRTGGGFDDSGAIIVGAGLPRDQTRYGSSNYGNRVDCQGWGAGIVTTCGKTDSQLRDSYGNWPPPDACYTKTFGQTSGATAMVAGVVACLQGALKGGGKAPLLPGEVRTLVSDPALGTPQPPQDAAGRGPIGPLPNLKHLKKLMEARRRRTEPQRKRKDH